MPARRLYYGWYVVAVAVFGGVVSAGSSQLFMGSLLPAVRASTGWSDLSVSWALLLGTGAGGLLSPFAGRWMDRYGPRVMLSAAAVVLAGGYLVIGLVPSLVGFFVGYVLLRGAAQGVLGGAPQRAIAVSWFRARRGRAMGLLSMSVPLGGAGLALIGQAALAHGATWRGVYGGLGVVTLAVLLPLCVAVMRRSPESMGLQPDGAPAPAPGTAALPPEPDYTLRQALRTAALRLLMAAATLGIAANGALIFYHVSFLTSRGIDAAWAVVCLSALALAGAVANLAWGFLAERYSERMLAITAQLGAAAAVLCLAFGVSGATSALAVSLLIGFAVRGESALTGLIVASYFGRGSFGAIAGLMGSFQLVGLGLGPVLAAALVGRTGSYAALYGAVCAALLVAAGLFALARPPR